MAVWRDKAGPMPASDLERTDRPVRSPGKGRTRSKGLVAILVALSLNLLIGYIGWRVSLEAGEQSDLIAQTQTFLVQLQATLSHLIDADAGARGYALSGKETLLDNYIAGKRTRNEDVELLRQLTGDDAARQRGMVGLAAQLRAAYDFSDDLVATRRRTNESLSQERLDENQHRIEVVRATIQEMQGELNLLLGGRRQFNRSAQSLSRVFILGGTLLGLAMMVLTGVIIVRESRRSDHLQENVEQRTLALEAENLKSANIQGRLRASEEMHRLMLDGIKDYAVYMLSPQGEVASWNTGAARIKGYETSQILGKHFRCFYSETDRLANRPEQALEEAVRNGRHEDSGWRVRRDGSEFWGNSVITPMYDENNFLRGFSKVVCDGTDRKDAEDRLRESQNQLAAVIQSAMDGVITVDEQQNVVLFNGTAERIFDCPASLAIGQPLERFLPQRFRAAHGAHIRGFGQTGVTSRAMRAGGPLRGMRSSGDEFPIEASISQIEVGGKKLFTAIVRDVTERERSHAVLREQAVVLDLTQALVRGLDGAIVLWTLGAQELYGFTKEEATGRVSHELLHTEFPEPLDQIETTLRAVGRWEGELAHRRRDGSRIVVSSVWVLHRDAENRPVRVLEANVDITARKQAEQELGRTEAALRLQTQMLHSILDSMDEGVVATDTNGEVILWNPAAEEILGREPTTFSRELSAGRYPAYRADGAIPFPVEELPLSVALAGRATKAEMMIFNPKLDASVWIEASGQPLKDEQGAKSGGVVAFRDITQRRADEGKIRKLNDELEQRVIQRTLQLEAANKELEAFTYSISHDLRAPLRHIAGFAEILMDEAGSKMDERTTRLLRQVREATRMMGQMVDELLSLARVGRQAPRLQVTGLNSLVDEVLGVLKAEYEDRRIEWHIAPLPFVDCDPTLIRLVFQNLISNALKYSRPRSPAVIEIGRTAENAIFVRDNGVGFSMKYTDKLFGVFQRLHRAEDFEGTGVGLATAQRIVQKHGGRMWAEAELDRGATFYFTVSAGEHSEHAGKMEELSHVHETH